MSLYGLAWGNIRKVVMMVAWFFACVSDCTWHLAVFVKIMGGCQIDIALSWVEEANELLDNYFVHSYPLLFTDKFCQILWK
jgi:hypothetical protein